MVYEILPAFKHCMPSHLKIKFSAILELHAKTAVCKVYQNKY